MARVGGTTPRGLPYPGSADIHAQTPAALQALAEAITAQLGGFAPGVVLDYFTGLKTLTGAGPPTGVWSHTFTELDAVYGAIGMVGPIALTGGVYTWGTVTVPYGRDPGTATPGLVDGRVVPIQPGESFTGVQVSLCLVAWGTRRAN